MIGVAVLKGDPIGHEVLAPTSAKGITSSLLKTSEGLPAGQALISVEAQVVRFRYDGTAPTATTGHVIPAGGSYVVEGVVALRKIRFIDTSAGASTVRVTTSAGE